MWLKSQRLVLPILLLDLWTGVLLSAQTTTSGGLTGVVTDQSNAVVPNAEVEIKDNRKGTIQSTTTDREGVYRFFFIAPTAYTLTVIHRGFRKESRTVDVLLGPPGAANIVLSIAEASSEITVSGEAPLIQAENGDVSATMNQKQVSEVPNPGNDLTYIVQTAPGVVMNTDSQNTGGIQNGAPKRTLTPPFASGSEHVRAELTLQMNYPHRMDHLEVLRKKVSHLRAEIGEIQHLNNQHHLHRGNDPNAQVAHVQRQERLQAIQRELVQLAALGPKIHSIEEMNGKHRSRLHLKRAS